MMHFKFIYLTFNFFLISFYTFSNENIGMPKALNLASKKAKFNYILISHDDFYYCPGWDNLLMNEVKLIDHKYFYLSGTMVGAVDKNNIKEIRVDSDYNPDNIGAAKIKVSFKADKKPEMVSRLIDSYISTMDEPNVKN